MNYILLLVGSVIILSVLTYRYTSRLAVPSLFFFIVLGMLFGVNGLFHISFDNYRIAEAICSISLIFIIFYGGFETNIKEARPAVVKSIILSTFGVAMTAATVGIFIHCILKVSWLESFLIGSVLSSTDAASVFHILRSRRLDLKDNTASVLELESGSNDPMAYMLTILFASLLSGQVFSVPYMFLCQLGIGLIFGFLLGKVTVWILHNIPFVIDEGRTIFTVAVMLLSFALPQLLGLLVTPSELPKVFFPAILIMLFLTFIARPIASIASLLPFGSGWRQLVVISWGGLRGAASIVFAIMATLSGARLEYDLYNLVFCVVLMSIVIQGTLLPWISNQMNMIDHNSDVRKTFNDYEAESNINFIKIKINHKDIFCNHLIKELHFPEDMLVVIVIRENEKIVPNGETLLKDGDVLVLAGPDFAEGDNFTLQERVLGKGNKWVGKPIQDIKLPQETLIVTVTHGDKTIIPAGDTVLLEHDEIVLAMFGK